LQKLWFYVHPTLHTLSILHTLTTDLLRVEEPEENDDDSSEEEDAEREERNRALGLGDLKAVIKNLLSPSAGLVKGGEVVTLLWERMRNNSGFEAVSIAHMSEH
jgi:gamma-tubulin complex component 2